MAQVMQFLPYILIIAVFYFLMIRPQQAKLKKEKEFESNLKVGDRIVTKSGMHGKVFEMADTTIIIETMSGKIKMERSSISLEMTQALKK